MVLVATITGQYRPSFLTLAVREPFTRVFRKGPASEGAATRVAVEGATSWIRSRERLAPATEHLTYSIAELTATTGFVEH